MNAGTERKLENLGNAIEETAAQRIFGEIRTYFPEIERAFAVIEAKVREG
jgi:hypothetical protein